MNSISPIKLGSVVELKSGGPLMTVTDVFKRHDSETGGEYVWGVECSWICDGYWEEKFPIEALRVKTDE